MAETVHQEQIQDIVATFVLFMIGCVICAVLLFVFLYIIIKSYKGKGAENNEIKEIQNVIVISTDQSIKFENTYNLSIDKDELILTDNYCPIDNLV